MGYMAGYFIYIYTNTLLIINVLVAVYVITNDKRLTRKNTSIYRYIYLASSNAGVRS